VVAPSAPGKEVLAIGATDKDGVFIALVHGWGLRCVDLSGTSDSGTPTSEWSCSSTPATPPAELERLEGTVAGDLGLHYHRPRARGEPAFVSFAEAPLSWVCWRLPLEEVDAGKAASTACAELVARTPLKDSIVSACSSPADGVVATAVAGGSFRFIDSVTGIFACKGMRLVSQGGGSKHEAPLILAHAGSHRVVAVRSALGVEVEVFFFKFDAEARRCEVEQSITLSCSVPMPALTGPLCGAAVIEPTKGKENLLLCWPSGDGLSWATCTPQPDGGTVRPLPAASGSASPSSVWACVGGFLVEFPQPLAAEPWSFTLREVRHGMPVTSGLLPPACRPARKGRAALIATDSSGDCTVFTTGGLVSGVRWSLPSFGLQMLIGSQVKQASTGGPLLPLHEVLVGKRKRDDAEVAALFARSKASKRAASEQVLAAELKSRSCKPSSELLDVVIQHECWEVCRQLLALPELDEDLVVRLIAARPCLLPSAIHHSFGSRRLASALREHLPAAKLPSVVEALVEILAAHREYTETELCKRMPGFPPVREVVAFLSALADGCLTPLTALDPQLLERVEEALGHVGHDGHRVENLYAAVSACCSVKKAPQLAAELRPVEVFLLPL